jgi:hypothetical protein
VVSPDKFEDTAAEFARSVQIVSPLPDQIQNNLKGPLTGETKSVYSLTATTSLLACLSMNTRNRVAAVAPVRLPHP